MVARAAKLNAEDKRKLGKALAEARRRTSARIKLTVVYVSDKYPLYSLVYGAITGIIVLGVLAIGWPHLALRTGFYAALCTTIVVTALLDIMPVRLKVIPRAAKFWECWELAHRSFASRILARNDRQTGILLFVSLGEHYVEVVTDRDVDRHIPQSDWDVLIRAFAVEAKARRYGAGLIGLVEGATALMEKPYPPASAAP